MKEKILNNFSLKILSAMCAIILWAVIVNIYDPSISVTVSGVNVTMVNEQQLIDKGYTYEVVDGSKISVYIKGPRSIVSDIKASDIVATADFKDITGFSDYVDIDVKIVKEGVSPSLLEITPKTTAIKLEIENREVKTLDIEVEVTGNPADGFVVSSKKISPATVKITGASSAIESVEKAKVVYDVSGVSFDISENVPIQLIGSDGNAISDDRIEMNREMVEFRVDLSMAKKVPVNFKTTGTPANGFLFSGVQYSTAEAIITGEDNVVQSINSIDIPAAAIDINGISADKDYVIDLSRYLPEGVTLLSDTKVTASVKINPVYEKEFAIEVDKINVTNVPTGYEADFGDTKSIKVIVTGPESTVNAIKSADLNATIKLSGTQTGVLNVPISLSVPAECKLKQDYTVTITIKEKGNGPTEAGSSVAP